MRWMGTLTAAIIVLWGCAPSSREPPIDTVLTAALDTADSLPPCPGQGRNEKIHYDCGVCRQREITGDHRRCEMIKYVRPPGAQRDTVVFEDISVHGGSQTYLTVPDVDPEANAFSSAYFTRDSPADIVPVINSSGKRRLAVWANRWHSDTMTSERLKLDDLPYGRLVPWKPECRLIALGEPGASNPWRMTLYRVQNLEHYDNKSPSFEMLGKLEAMRKSDGSCVVTGDEAIAASGLPADEFDAEMCEWLDDTSDGIHHHIPDCKDVDR
jgi:hypothetical protein